MSSAPSSTAAPAEHPLETPEAPADFLAYVASFGLTLEELTANDLRVLLLARKVEQLVADLRIKVAVTEVPGTERQLMERKVERVLERTRYVDRTERSPIPADQQDVALIESPEQLPEILPTQWLMDELAPDQFAAQLHSRELLRREWQRTVQQPITVQETVEDTEFVEVQVPPQTTRQHAYVLLDASGSMQNAPVRAPLAKALALAFLRRGESERAKLAIRPFTGRVGELLTGRTREDLAGIVRTVLSWEMCGSDTHIQGALERAVEDIRAGGEFTRADILLITDGLSRLGENPLGAINLHTLLIGPRKIRSDARERTLKVWSGTFRRVDESDYEDDAAVDPAVIDELDESLHAIPDEMASADATDTQGRQQQFQALWALLQRLRGVAESAGTTRWSERLEDWVEDGGMRRAKRRSIRRIDQLLREAERLAGGGLAEAERRGRAARAEREAIQAVQEEEAAQQRHAIAEEARAQSAREIREIRQRLGFDGDSEAQREGAGQEQGEPPERRDRPEEQQPRVSFLQRIVRALQRRFGPHDSQTAQREGGEGAAHRQEQGQRQQQQGGAPSGGGGTRSEMPEQRGPMGVRY